MEDWEDIPEVLKEDSTTTDSEEDVQLVRIEEVRILNGVLHNKSFLFCYFAKIDDNTGGINYKNATNYKYLNI